MTIQSMTGFARSKTNNENYLVTVEIKSVNHRFKDLRFKMPSILSSLEIELRKILNNSFKRGHFEISINYKSINTSNYFNNLDEEKVNLFIKKISDIAKKTSTTVNISPTDFLRNEFLLEQKDELQEELNTIVKETVIKAVEQLKISRQEEGNKLREIIEKHLVTFQTHFKKIEPLTDDYQEKLTKKIHKKFTDLLPKENIEESRFLQEIVYYLEKLDINEEINRIETHLLKLNKLLSSNNEIGREIDFTIQELNRETNTIASKSGNTTISNCAIQMKMQLEKIREQGLNLE